jgi:hypothetical protein
MVLPLGLIKTQSASTNNLKPSNVSQANNQNSILMSLKDTLHQVKFYDSVIIVYFEFN